jgi:hypothetical protein
MINIFLDALKVMVASALIVVGFSLISFAAYANCVCRLQSHDDYRQTQCVEVNPPMPYDQGLNLGDQDHYKCMYKCKEIADAKDMQLVGIYDSLDRCP